MVDHGGELFPFAYDPYVPNGHAYIVLMSENPDGSTLALRFMHKTMMVLPVLSAKIEIV
jgi:hypothetical protein